MTYKRNSFGQMEWFPRLEQTDKEKLDAITGQNTGDQFKTVAAYKLIGRGVNSVGAAGEIAIGTGLRLSANTLSVSGAGSLPILTPVNAIASGFVATVAARPDDYIKNIQASKTLTVASQPRVNVFAQGTVTVSGTPVITFTQATGTITVSGTPVAEEILTIGDETYVFKALANSEFEITIDADNTAQANNIVATITNDSTTVSATNLAGVVTITAKNTYPGVLGNAIILTEDATGVTGIAVSGTGTLANGSDSADNTLTVKNHIFTFVLSETPAAGEITINADNTIQAANIVTALAAIADDVTATSDGAVVTITSVAAGEAGNLIALLESATGIDVSGAVLAGGVDADTLSIDAVTYTFITNGATPVGNQIPIGTTTALTAESIASITPTANYTIAAVNNTVTVTAVAAGVAGNGIVITADDTRITGDGNTAGGQDEVKSMLSINGYDYIFGVDTGDDPLEEYPSCKPVITVIGATTTQIAAALVLALESDTSIFAPADVSNTDNIITVKTKTKGIIGNAYTYQNHLVTATDITVTGITDGLFTGGVDGTPGFQGQTYFDGSFLYICSTDNETTTNASWLKFAPTA
jgi:hypothetical protein